MDHIGQLKPDTRNPRLHPERNVRAIVKSLEEIGAARSIVIDEDGRILCGNGLVDAAGIAGIERLRVIEADGNEVIAVQRKGLTEAQKKRLAVLDNRAGELAEWDSEVLAELIDEGVDLSDLWFPEELDALLNPPLPVTVESGLLSDADPDEIPEAVETRCKPGDLWQLGRHRLYVGDCTDALSLEALCGERRPNMVWADPPYGIAIVAANVTVGGGEVNNIPFGGVKDETPEEKIKRLQRRGDVGGPAAHMRKTGKPYIADKGRGSIGGAAPFGSQSVRGSDGASNMIEVGKYAPIIGDDTTDTATDSYNLIASVYADAVHVWWGGNYYADKLPPSSCWIVWDKQNTGNFADAELAWTNQKTAVRIFSHMWNGLMKASERGEKRVHPTQKPVALAEWAFEKYGSENDLILDPFCGSGMSIIAAEKMNRTVFALEMSPEYCSIVIERWEKATGKQAVLISDEV